jgi:cell division ATPase FtsA
MQDIKALFDIGNGRIKGVVFAQDEGKTVVLVKDMMKTKGLRKGKLLDMEEFVTNMNTLIEGFVKKLGGDYIDEVCVTISHPELLRERLSEQKRVM